MAVEDVSVRLVGLSVQPAAVVSGRPPVAIGIVTLSDEAPDGGLTVELSSDNPALAEVPASLAVPQGVNAGFFEVTVSAVDQPTNLSISASYQGVTTSAQLTVLPVAADSTSADVPVLSPPEATVQIVRGQSTADSNITVAASRTTIVASGPAPMHPSDMSLSEPGLQPTPLPIQTQQSYRAALLTLTPALPFAATICTLIIYLAPLQPSSPAWVLWMKANPLLVGTVGAVLLWLAAAWCYSALFRGTSADQANVTAYTQLSQRLREIDGRLTAAASRADLSATELTACTRASVIRELIRIELTKSGAGWVLGTSYINAWALVHRAEEALFLVQPTQEVAASALYDEMRLQGSEMDNSSQLLAKLRLAVSRIAPEAAVYLTQQPPAASPASPAEPALSSDQMVDGARLTLRDVRQAINEFRDSSWAALVRTRNHLLGTMTITGLVTYLLLTVAISGRGGDAPANLTTDVFAAAATLYLIGAVVGLFNRLYAESGSDNSIEDYGLTVARTGLTPVLSGLAALGGVLIIAILPAALSGDILAPTTTVVTQAPGGAASDQPAAQVVKKTAPSLDNVFNLSANPLSIILAAVFGLTPNLLISALQNAGDRYRSAVQSTSASTQSH